MWSWVSRGLFPAPPFQKSEKVKMLCVPFLCPSAWFLNGCFAIIGMHSRLFCPSPVSGVLFLSIPKCNEQLLKPLPLWRSGEAPQCWTGNIWIECELCSLLCVPGHGAWCSLASVFVPVELEGYSSSRKEWVRCEGNLLARHWVQSKI